MDSVMLHAFTKRIKHIFIFNTSNEVSSNPATRCVNTVLVPTCLYVCWCSCKIN